MKFYPENFNVEVIVGFTDLNGQVVTPTAVSAALHDGEDELIVDFGSLPFDPAEGSKSIIIPPAFNLLEDGELRSARILRVALQTDAGTIRRSHSYVIEAEQRLVVMTNTFQTYEAAEIAALDVPNVSGWNVATEDRRKAALVEAFQRLTSIPMKYAHRDHENRLRMEAETIIERDQWEEVTAELFAEFPTHFKKALRKAQFIEANELLQGDAATKKHRAGIITETIGESSVTLRGGRVDYGVSTQTLSALAGYIYFNMRIARA